jgi:alpha-glucosidase
MDFVLNHTSDQHKWFLDSSSLRDSAHRDWYIWRDGKDGGPPNNWNSTFAGSAWTFDSETRQYYYHKFYAQQPDLNWRNPQVKNAMFDLARWWYERGVAGFRLDAVDALFEDPQLRDNPLAGGFTKYGDPIQKPLYDAAPENHSLLRELRKLSDEYQGVLIGETWTKTIEQLQAYYGREHDELQMPMDFMFFRVKTLSPADFRKQIALAETLKDWPVYVFSNHDEPRAYDRYGDGQHNDAIAKLTAALYLTLRGTPILYYGEEIGMENNDPKRKEDVKDLIGKVGWPGDKGRDGERTPMQWTRGRNAGFTNGTPWLPIPSSATTHNVESEAKDSNSILSFYRQLLMLRHRNSALLDGDYLALNEDDSHVLSYLRRYKGERVLVALNMSASSQEMTFSEGMEGVDLRRAKALLTTSMSHQEGASKLLLGPFGVYIGEVSKGSR